MLIGLGNHKPELLGTRHNLGYELVDQLRQGCWHQCAGTKLSVGEEVLLAAPNKGTLNTSGEDLLLSVDPAQPMVVIIDDLNLQVGQWRYRQTGSSGGHKGLQNIIDHLGYEPPRLRIGIGRPNDEDILSHVLGKPQEEEAQILKATLRELQKSVKIHQKLWLKDAIQATSKQKAKST